MSEVVVNKILAITLGIECLMNDFQKEGKFDNVFEKRKELIKNYYMDENDKTELVKIHAYKLTKYKFKDCNDTDEKESFYLVNKLVEKFTPNVLAISGTIKTCWDMFLISAMKDAFTPDEEFNEIKFDEFMSDIYEISSYQTYDGYKLSTEEIKSRNERITEIYTKWYKWADKKYDIKINVIHYGIDETQNKENYAIFKQMWQELISDEDKKYEIALDITHSFRSIPFFSLVQLNYLKQVTNKNVEIKHIYYGCFESFRELGYAPVVELQELINVLDLTGAVTEFKNTGNATTLLNLPNKDLDDASKQLIKDFDWGVHLNDRERIVKNVCEMNKEIEKRKQSGGQSKYDDMWNLLDIVFKEKEIGKLEPEDGENEIRIKAYNQYYLAKWYLAQSQYGLALVASDEALRSFLHSIFDKYKNTEKNSKTDEEWRKQVADILKNRAKQFQTYSHKSDAQRLMCDLNEGYEKVHKKRSSFAHNLSMESSSGKNETEYIQSLLDEFIGKLTELIEEINKPNSEFVYLFNHEGSRNNNNKKTNKQKYFILQMPYKTDEGKIELEPINEAEESFVNDRKEDCKYLPKISKKAVTFKKNKKINRRKLAENCEKTLNNIYELVKQEEYQEYDIFNIILCGFDSDIELVYSVVKNSNDKYDMLKIQRVEYVNDNPGNLAISGCGINEFLKNNDEEQ